MIRLPHSHNRNYIWGIATPPEEHPATVKGEMHKKFGTWWSSAATDGKNKVCAKQVHSSANDDWTRLWTFVQTVSLFKKTDVPRSVIFQFFHFPALQFGPAFSGRVCSSLCLFLVHRFPGHANSASPIKGYKSSLAVLFDNPVGLTLTENHLGRLKMYDVLIRLSGGCQLSSSASSCSCSSSSSSSFHSIVHWQHTGRWV